jgi:hypothetical protein
MDVLAHSRDLLPNNRRLREGALSRLRFVDRCFAIMVRWPPGVYPGRHQHGDTVWPAALLLVAHERFG